MMYKALLVFICAVLWPLNSFAQSHDTRRVVVLGGIITETVYAIGKGDRVIAVDASSLYPADTDAKRTINYHRSLSSEGIVALQPTLVLATAAAGPPAAIDQIKSAGIPVLTIESDDSEAGAKDLIRKVAQIFDAVEAGENVVQKLDADLRKADEMLKERKNKDLKILFLYARGQNTMLAGGRDSSGEWIINRVGAKNAVTGFEGYKPLNSEALVAAAPDVILIPERGLQSLDSLEGLLKQPGVALTPAGKNRNVVTIDDAKLLSFGPRLGEALQEIIVKLYP